MDRKKGRIPFDSAERKKESHIARDAHKKVSTFSILKAFSREEEYSNIFLSITHFSL